MDLIIRRPGRAKTVTAEFLDPVMLRDADTPAGRRVIRNQMSGRPNWTSPIDPCRPPSAELRRRRATGSTDPRVFPRSTPGQGWTDHRATASCRAAPSFVLSRTYEPRTPDDRAAVLVANLPRRGTDLDQGAIVVIERSRRTEHQETPGSDSPASLQPIRACSSTGATEHSAPVRQRQPCDARASRTVTRAATGQSPAADYHHLLHHTEWRVRIRDHLPEFIPPEHLR